MKKSKHLDAILFRERGYFILQCLQYDFNSQGKTIDDCFSEFERLLIGYTHLQIERSLPVDPIHLPQAPNLYWRRYEHYYSHFFKELIVKTDVIDYSVTIKSRR